MIDVYYYFIFNGKESNRTPNGSDYTIVMLPLPVIKI